MSRLRVGLVTWAVVVVGSLLPLSTASAQQLVKEACPHVGTAPNPSCTNQPLSGEGWTVAAMSRPDPAKLELYRSLVPERFYAMPKDPMIAFVGIRLDVPGDFGMSDADPRQGYMETSVMLRVANKNGGEEGWFPLATPVNDESQYDAGRFVGLPKWRSDITIAHDRSNDSWIYTATKPGDPRAVFEQITWLPEAAAPAPAADPALRTALERFIFFDDPMFSTVQAWDAPDDEAARFPERVKFTISSYVPDDGPVAGPPSPYTTRGKARYGTSMVSVSDIIGPSSLPRWRGLLPDGVQRLPGMFVNLNGTVVVSSERVDGKPGPGGTVTPTDPGPDANPSGGGGPSTGGSTGGSGEGTASGCLDRIPPSSRISRRSLSATRRGLRVSGKSADQGCGRVARVQVSLARQGARGCRYLRRSGGFGRTEPCRAAHFRTARGTSRWRATLRVRLRPGRYRLFVRGVDRAGNVERQDPSRPAMRLRVR